MQIKYFALISLALSGGYIHSSATVSTLTTATANLLKAQNALSTLLTTNYGQQGTGTIQTTIANNSVTPVSAVVFDNNNTKINTIILTGYSFSYLPYNATGIQLVDAKKKTLTAITPVKTNTPYSITHSNNIWEITELTETASYNYTNTTNIPVIITITTNNLQIKEEINPTELFLHTINPATNLGRKNFLKYGNIKTKYSQLVSVQVHANLSSITTSCNPKASYEINITNGQLVCIQTSATGNKITNKTGWRMFINAISENKNINQFVLEDKDTYEIDSSIDQISILPLIENQSFEYKAAKSLSITNVKGVLTL